MLFSYALWLRVRVSGFGLWVRGTFFLKGSTFSFTKYLRDFPAKTRQQRASRGNEGNEKESKDRRKEYG